MARHKLKDYLDNPSLLRTISEEEMRAWAAEVPYAGLVQRLLAQKLAMEAASKEDQDHANVLAILSNVNPNQTIKSIEDFKDFVLAGSANEPPHSGKLEDDWERALNLDFEKSENQDADLVPESAPMETYPDRLESTEVISEIPEHAPSSTYEDAQVVDNLKEKDEASFDTEVENEESDSDISENESSDYTEKVGHQEASAFTIWLESLQSLEEDEPVEDSALELADKALASDALAQLLVEQGHIDRAIAMYEMLLLKNPQKSSFFAAQIEKLKRS